MNVKFKIGLKANLPKTGIVEGTWYLAKDAGELYYGDASNQMVLVDASNNLKSITITAGSGLQGGGSITSAGTSTTLSHKTVSTTETGSGNFIADIQFDEFGHVTSITRTDISLSDFGVTASSDELNYTKGVTSSIQTQLNEKASTSSIPTAATVAPKDPGTAAVGTSAKYAREDHVHPLQTTVSGNAGTATKLATAKTISLSGDVTGSTTFDGSANVSITATVADDSHNHVISNIDGLQTALDAKAPLASPALTGTPTAPTAAAATNNTQVATTAFVKTAVNSAISGLDGAMVFKGTIGSTGATVTVLPASHTAGWTYVVATAGTYAGETCEVGDMITCVKTGTTAADADWNIVQNNINGAVTGPANAVDGQVALFNGSTGKIIKAVNASTLSVGSATNSTNWTGKPSWIGSSKPTYTASEVGAAPSSHTQSYTTLTGSTTTANQAIVSSGTANGWTLKTLATVATSGSYNDLSNKPTITNTTYTFANGTNGFTVTPSGGSAQTVTVTPSISNNVTYTGTMTANQVVTVSSGGVVKSSGFTIATSVPSGAKFTDTTYSAFSAATSSAAGSSGLVPAPAAGKQTSFLRGDGTWVIPTDTNTTYTFAGGTAGSFTVTPSGGSAQTVSIGKPATAGTADTATTANKTTGTLTFTGGSTSTFNGSSNVSVAIPTASSLGAITTISASGALSASKSGTTVTLAHSTAAGYQHIPAGGSSGQYLKWSSAGVAAWAAGPTSSVTFKDGYGTSGSGSDVTISGDGVVDASLDSATRTYNLTWARPSYIQGYAKTITVNGTSFIVNASDSTAVSITTGGMTYTNYTYSVTSISVSAGTCRYPSSYTNYSSALTVSLTGFSPSKSEAILVVYGTRTVSFSSNSNLIKMSDIPTTGSSASTYRIYAFQYLGGKIAVNCAEYTA